ELGRTASVHVDITLDRRSELSGDLYRQLRRRILDGRLPPGERLPPSRDLAQRLAVSRSTVVVAYDRLAGEGFLDAKVGAGTFVSDQMVSPSPGLKRAGLTYVRTAEPALSPRTPWTEVTECLLTDIR